MNGLEPIRGALGETLHALGIGDLRLLVELVEEWETVAGEPWAGQTRPVLVREGELVVEADGGGAAGMLRYAISELLVRLEGRFGPGLVSSVRLQVARPSGEPGTARQP